MDSKIGIEEGLVTTDQAKDQAMRCKQGYSGTEGGEYPRYCGSIGSLLDIWQVQYGHDN